MESVVYNLRKGGWHDIRWYQRIKNNLIAIELLAQSGTLPDLPPRVTLSFSYQPIIMGAEPTMNKDIALRYIIEAANTGRLLNKPAGMYSTTITYSFTAQ